MHDAVAREGRGNFRTVSPLPATETATLHAVTGQGCSVLCSREALGSASLIALDSRARDALNKTRFSFFQKYRSCEVEQAQQKRSYEIHDL